LGIITFLNYNNINLDGKNVVIVGRSKLVGEPLAKLFLQKNATVTLCHSHTKNIQWHTTMADIVVCAAGRAKLLTKEHFLGNRSQIVIDVGINREEGKLIGDVDPAVSEFVNYLTPVPGGVGLLTRAALMENVLKTRF
jgi:methylenetetrahydrofolate dehydrogenase (NADP+)/methenyltetrahydrofolate cyclohydrolase